MTTTTINAIIDKLTTSKEFAYTDYFPYSYPRDYHEIILSGDFTEIRNLLNTVKGIGNYWNIGLDNTDDLVMTDATTNEVIKEIENHDGIRYELYSHGSEYITLCKNYFIEGWDKDVHVNFRIKKADILTVNV